MVTVEPLPHPLLQLFQPLTGDFHIGDDVGVGEVSVKQLPRERILLRGLPFRKTFRLPFRKALRLSFGTTLRLPAIPSVEISLGDGSLH